MSQPTDMCCETCRFWDNSAYSGTTENETGQCRAVPPGFDNRTGLAIWPFTEPDDWCGSHADIKSAAISE